MSESYRLIRLERHGALAEIVLNNPGSLNAMQPLFFAELAQAFAAVTDDDTVSVVLIWAEGRVFSVGLDLKEAMGLIPELGASASTAARNRALYRIIRDFQACFTAVRRCRKPVIAAIHGMCLGGGLDLASACDIRLAAADAMLAIQETKMAMVADLGTLQRIGRLCGSGFVREMAFTGSMIGAQRAQAVGLVNEVFSDRIALMEAARRMAGVIAANSSLAVQGVKQVLDHADDHSEEEGLEYVAQWNTNFFLSRDLNEALQAFRDKREPRFSGD
ncbi:crotonase/enoyl-CoA hydratase family protein [Massilia pseudoviolaceinigra]|uniref:crotonase/enoyl-CoA hydratase family protein n=1 Tax=Massilia pseudoviolaceinigra TaxID=3057165 RepID=UPI0027965EB7|nr:crotonase/enoyl-CoA hydratase family protein [Massilia sp. CCM 9206]MDQ1919232.1 crotonase/enoyl-CoA hydratase family protein [Massilia sp. CCM 9206]